MESRAHQRRLVARGLEREQIVAPAHAAAQHDLGIREMPAQPAGRLGLGPGARADAGQIQHDERPDPRRPRATVARSVASAPATAGEPPRSRPPR